MFFIKIVQISREKFREFTKRVVKAVSEKFTPFEEEKQKWNEAKKQGWHFCAVGECAKISKPIMMSKNEITEHLLGEMHGLKDEDLTLYNKSWTFKVEEEWKEWKVETYHSDIGKYLICKKKILKKLINLLKIFSSTKKKTGQV